MGYIWNDRTDVAILATELGAENSEICTTQSHQNHQHHSSFYTHNMGVDEAAYSKTDYFHSLREVITVGDP